MEISEKMSLQSFCVHDVHQSIALHLFALHLFVLHLFALLLFALTPLTSILHVLIYVPSFLV
jgi:hypothetical protein